MILPMSFSEFLVCQLDYTKTTEKDFHKTWTGDADGPQLRIDPI